tara:strand:+ start:196 stop:489 length:294 start_codon:yes stop_codon:yes gene_type:complete
VSQAKRSGVMTISFAKTFVTEPAAVLVHGGREVILLEVANRYGLNHAVTFVRSLNGRGDLLGVLRVEPIDVEAFHMSHNCKQYTTDAENVNPFFYFF